MSQWWRFWLLSIITMLGGVTPRVLAGTALDAETYGFTTQPPQAGIWNVIGQVLTVRGDPLEGVTVQMDIGPDSEVRRSTKTNLQGKFEINLKLEQAKYPRLRGTLVASKTGYVEGRETLDLGSAEQNSSVYIVLRELREDPDQLSMTKLVSTLGPRLRKDSAISFAEESSRKEFVRGCEELIDQGNAVAAIPLLNGFVEHTPHCIECRLLLSLALLEGGSWGSAYNQLEQASKANEANAAKRPEPALVTGVLKAWRGDVNEAARYYQRALEADPQNTLALQELGRTLVVQKNWEAADLYLEKALQAEAGEDARILRIRALLELGDISEAAREMDHLTAGREIKNLPQAERALFSEVQSRLELLSYGLIKSVIDQSPGELIPLLPGLQGLEPTMDQSILEEVLQKTGAGVDAFFKNFPNTVSLEQVHQERLANDGKIKMSLDQEFQYLMLANPERPGLGIEEHRSTAEGRDSSLSGLNKGLMLTSGFASGSSIFHPLNRSGADFRYLGKQMLDGHETHVVAFAQRPQTAKMVGRFVTDKGTALILVQGVAWIDSKAFRIIRLDTVLLNPLPIVRLQSQTTEIHFQQVVFNEGRIALWLPREVTVMVNWKGRVLRNQHRYSDFKLFSIDVKEDKKSLQKRESALSGNP